MLGFLVILTVMAIGSGRRMHVELALAKYSLSKVKARYRAWAGFQYARSQILKTPDKNTVDTIYQCGVEAKAINQKDSALMDDTWKGLQQTVKISDEDRKINLNALTVQNYRIFQALLTVIGVSEPKALAITTGVMAWIDVGLNIDGTIDKAKTPVSLGIKPKKRPFDSVDELMLIDGVTPDIYAKLKDHVTTFPKKPGQLTVNINTAPEEVLQALGRSVTGGVTNTSIQDADALARKIVEYRRGIDAIDGTSDDRVAALDTLALNAKEEAIFLTIAPFVTRVSKYFDIDVKGVEPESGVSCNLHAIVNRKDLTIAAWSIDP